jgi:hypothetical protein
MQEILFEYELNPTTWVYLSSLMTIGIYFKFRRFWSLRNLDLVGLIAFSPGLLLVSHGQEQLGYLWLFCVGGFFMVRLLSDPMMVRRPLLDPNLNVSGLTFTGVALLVFLIASVVTGKLPETNLDAPQNNGGQHQSQDDGKQQVSAHEANSAQLEPGYPWFYKFAGFANEAFVPHDASDTQAWRQSLVRVATVRTTAILAHLAVVIGMVLIGYRHFGSVTTGVAAASLYLLLPYTAQMTMLVDHVVPAALLVWAVLAYRWPVVAGVLVGSAAGVIFYPLFLLPLWCGFYWRRGLFRFVGGVVFALVVLVVALVFTSDSLQSLVAQLQQMFGWSSLSLESGSGFWDPRYHAPAFRIPVMAAFLALCGSLALWPPQKNLGTLLSCSAAVMLGTQFWQAHHGGVYIAWYLPLLLLTIFRPNLEDRVALTTVREGWFGRRHETNGS